MSDVLQLPTLDDERHPLHALRKELNEQRQQREKIERLLQEFTTKLYAGFEYAVETALAAGVKGLHKPRRIPHPAGGWRQALQLPIEDWFVIIVPLVGAARPNVRDEARLPNARFKELSGRIALFIGDDPTGEAFYDILIFSDASWFAWGYGWPRMADAIATTDFNYLAFELLASFVKDIYTKWRVRRTKGAIEGTTQLQLALDAKKRVYTFGLPGDE
ncbi:MAG: hypothetical protein CUN49_04595 [Candidatus Thermofonsia Clade 1 bacterium]|jgi:hypothetical protein|uniref:Uncharacterized protein n=1 Tax=Candidatus Thermofonsia Clade 1 bacterium TaxID=2364210 RepID=A0A2M8PGD9_9CHLR|nr:MAG: hypothetical protein CUN49_04595 [Candidatus Thermofonsia Clade 1 bacterium]RMF50539.1 MAG: hypothetical protein D6749_10230 [Chloroflexota bacterium]